MSTTEHRSLLHVLSDYEQVGTMPDDTPSRTIPPRQIDGYVRRTRVQALRTDESFVRNRKHKIIRSALLAVFVVLIIIVIIRSGMINI